LLYLPPDGPDVNPIEMTFSKLKAVLRKAAERNVASLWARITELIKLVPQYESANHIATAGYDPT
jgi:transposase